MHPFEYFFTVRYAEAYQAEREAEEARRAEAFLDVARPVAGVALRPLTPRDLMVLDGFGSPLVCGDPGEATPDHIIAVLWLLRARTPLRWFSRLAFHLHRRMLLGRWRNRELRLRDHADLKLWFDDVFADSGMARTVGAETRAPIGTHFLSSLLVPVSCEMGAFDPASGRPMIEAPLARLFQYNKTLRAKKEGRDFVDFSASDRLKGEALQVWNDMSAAEQAYWATEAKEAA